MQYSRPMQNTPLFDPQLRVLWYADAMRRFGNPRQLALKLGIAPAAVYQWKGAIPWGRMAAVQELLSETGQDHARGVSGPDQPQSAR